MLNSYIHLTIVLIQTNKTLDDFSHLFTTPNIFISLHCWLFKLSDALRQMLADGVEFVVSGLNALVLVAGVRSAVGMTSTASSWTGVGGGGVTGST